MPTIRIMWILSGLMALAGPVRLIGQDWPTFAHDAWRSAATSATVSLPLGRSWEYAAAHPPRPAWPPPAKHDYWHDKMHLSPRVTYDHAFQVAAVGDRVYFGTSGDDRIVCLDGRTGECCWSFYTEGPVRLAPTVVDGRVYAGSDDGMVYCLAADGGALIWQQRVGPTDSRCIGNGRMISRWPVRSGVLVQDGIAYCAGGLFPVSEGVFLVGFEAKTGEEIWRRKIAQSVQGYMALTDQQLVLPSGRTSPSIYGCQDGRLLGEIASGGGAFALVADDLLVAGPGDSTDGQMSLAEPRTREPLMSLSGLHLIASGRHLFVHTRAELAALDRDRFLPLARERAAIQKEIAALEELKDAASKARSAELSRARAAVDVRIKACCLWRTPCQQHESLILAGDKLFAGGDERVVAFDANHGTEIWSASVRGRACGLACAQGRLLVSTDLGSICCFEPEAALTARGSERGTSSRSDGLKGDTAPPRPELDTANGLLKGAGADQGFCLILGAGDGQLARAIAQQSRLQIMIAEHDANKVAATRRCLEDCGLYGTRVAVHQLTGDRLPYPPYFANLIVVQASYRDRETMSGQEVLRLLRPSGGTACIEMPQPGESQAPAPPDRWQSVLTQEGLQVSQEQCDGRLWLMARRGAIAGGGEWTHGLADPGNTACSRDELVHGPLRIQWFGYPGPRLMADRHHRNVPPLAKDGRLFIPGENRVIAVDAYNGFPLWEREIPHSLRLGAFLDCSNMAVDDRVVYVAAEDACHLLDVTNGEVVQRHTLPQLQADQPRHWAYLATVGGRIIGSARKPGAAYFQQSRAADESLWNDRMSLVTSDYLFALDPGNGNALWTYQSGVVVNTSIAIGDGLVCFLESGSQQAGRHTLGRMPMTTFQDGPNFLVALHLDTGKTAWRRPFDLSNCQHMVYANLAGNRLLVSGNRYIDGNLWYFFSALDTRTGQTVWETSHNAEFTPGGEHGEQNCHPTIVGDVVYTHPFAYELQTGKRLEGWKFDRRGHGCGNISASAGCIYWRGHNPWRWDLFGNQQPHRINSVTRPGCFINIIPAGGVLLIPEASSGCTCGYPLQTSLAYVPETAVRD